MTVSPDLTDQDIPLPQFGAADPDIIGSLAAQNVLLTSHNRALEATCLKLKAQVNALRARLAPPAADDAPPIDLDAALASIGAEIVGVVQDGDPGAPQNGTHIPRKAAKA